jgi:hypothetical protein
MLTDPRASLAEQDTVATALTGLAHLARTVRILASAGHGSRAPVAADDDLIHMLLAVVSLSDAVHRLADPQPPDAPPTPPPPPGAWLR